ncbi:hypothetical protein [Archaeoglobus veneficus]|uniref:Uncharacterized protein n=1 Tax=Archaeoglobus veneficus (strain DSM 11195 / SNP6) TaxID=693661 RepID=F2KR08_ARCVS|nr:hypothetical protein [Archaeoglobus veneficus]AEA47814.1 hypothetical protein Arcve_1818 [Archaeoglobus veneficus SNP6]
MDDDRSGDEILEKLKVIENKIDKSTNVTVNLTGFAIGVTYVFFAVGLYTNFFAEQTIRIIVEVIAMLLGITLLLTSSVNLSKCLPTSKRELRESRSKNLQKEININVEKRSETVDGGEQIKLVKIAGGYLTSFVLLFLGHSLIINEVVGRPSNACLGDDRSNNCTEI